jgi:hypothetical protein
MSSQNFLQQEGLEREAPQPRFIPRDTPVILPAETQSGHAIGDPDVMLSIEEPTEFQLDQGVPCQDEVQIDFFVREGTTWKMLPPLTVSPGDAPKVESAVKNYFWSGYRAFNTKLELLSFTRCFEAIVQDGTYTILLIAEDELCMDNGIQDTAAEIHADAISRNVFRATLRPQPMVGEATACVDGRSGV